MSKYARSARPSLGKEQKKKQTATVKSAATCRLYIITGCEKMIVVG